MIRKIPKPILLLSAGFSGGALCGFAWWYFVGCASGTCPITSNPYSSSLYGALTGAIVLFPDVIFKKKKND